LTESSGFFQLWFAVRYVHVASVTVLAGGALMTCVRFVSSQSQGELETRSAIAAAAIYEWTFWSVVGLTAVTGVSNLGLKGDGLLGPETNWGTALSVKLAMVFAILAVSLIRSDVVIRSGSVRPADPERIRRALATLYGLTAVVLMGALWIGLGLAHGRY
jgi:hypothetical protein